MKNDSFLHQSFWWLLNLVLLTVLIFGLKGLSSGSFVALPRTIMINADGKATLTPDIAKLSFSVVTDGKDPKVIQDENTKKMNAAIQFVKGQGVDDKDIKTQNYNLSPVYDYSRLATNPFIVGYSLSQTVAVKVRDLSKVASILGGLPGLGVNQIDAVSFEVENQDKYLNQARQEAFAAARSKAEAMAKDNGVRLGKVMTFSESVSGGRPIFYAETLGKGGADANAPAPTIEPGSQEVTVNVDVTYEIR